MGVFIFTKITSFTEEDLKSLVNFKNIPLKHKDDKLLKEGYDKNNYVLKITPDMFGDVKESAKLVLDLSF